MADSARQSSSSSDASSATAPLVRPLEQGTLDEIEKALERWQVQTRALRTVHAILTVAATACSLLVAAKVLADRFVSFAAFGAALSIGLLSAFDLGSKANRLRRAWRLLRAEFLRFRENRCDAERLIDTYLIAEDIIGDVKEEPR